MSNDEHTPVLLHEVLDGLNLRADGCYLDCTFGRGGHSRAILERLGAHGRVIALDRDSAAVAAADDLAARDPRLSSHRAGFSGLAALLEREQACGRLDGVLFDLGVSSPQLDDPGRGFSFQHGGVLDMRMDPDTGTSAAEWLNSAQPADIARVLREYGEERHARRIARAIDQARREAPVTTTDRLAGIIVAASPSRERDKHPATRCFQAIRIHINNELEELRQGLDAAFACLRGGGRLLVISFHSLEDRIVKRFMRDLARGDPYPRELPVPARDLQPRLVLIGKPVTPGAAEVRANPRARSARLRIGEKLVS